MKGTSGDLSRSNTSGGTENGSQEALDYVDSQSSCNAMCLSDGTVDSGNYRFHRQAMELSVHAVEMIEI